MSDAAEDGEPDATPPESMNRRSVAGLIASVALAIVGLFALPPLRAAGLTFMEAFWTTIAIEFVAFVGVTVSVLTLYRARTLE